MTSTEAAGGVVPAGQCLRLESAVTLHHRDFAGLPGTERELGIQFAERLGITQRGRRPLVEGGGETGQFERNGHDGKETRELARSK